MIKATLDTAKVGNFERLYGELPKGVTKTETEFIMWRIAKGDK